jgi:hypothetical protein
LIRRSQLTRPEPIHGLSDEERALLGDALRTLRRERGKVWNAACDVAEAAGKRSPSLRPYGIAEIMLTIERMVSGQSHDTRSWLMGVPGQGAGPRFSGFAPSPSKRRVSAIRLQSHDAIARTTKSASRPVGRRIRAGLAPQKRLPEDFPVCHAGPDRFKERAAPPILLGGDGAKSALSSPPNKIGTPTPRYAAPAASLSRSGPA